MTRSTLSSANRTQINLATVGSVHLVALEFPSRTVFTCTGSKTFEHDGDDYLADGKVLSVGGLSERGDGTQDPLVLVLSGADDELAELFDGEDWHFCFVRLYQLFFDEGWVKVDVHELGAYYMSHSSERDGAEESLNELTSENALYSEGARVDAVLCDDALHRARSPNDTYFANVLALIDREVIWGGVPVQVGGAGGGLPSGPGVINLPQVQHLPVPLPGDPL